MAAGDGLVSMTPTSIAHSGTSASINADGGVDFTAVTSLSLNGVFTSEMDNYLVVSSVTVAAGIPSLLLQLRASGSDATGTNYTRQSLDIFGTTRSAARSTSQSSWTITAPDDIAPNGITLHMYGPALAQPTAVRSVTIYSYDGASIWDQAGTHSLSTSYDGFTISLTSSNITGTIHVFGYEE
jgi:hypothetical protein